MFIFLLVVSEKRTLSWLNCGYLHDVLNTNLGQNNKIIPWPNNIFNVSDFLGYVQNRAILNLGVSGAELVFSEWKERWELFSELLDRLPATIFSVWRPFVACFSAQRPACWSTECVILVPWKFWDSISSFFIKQLCFISV